MRLWFLTAAAAGLMTAPAMAAPYHASGVTVQNAAAVLNVVAEDRQDVDVTMQGSGRLPAPSVTLQGDRVMIDGGLRNRIEGCGGGWFQVQVGDGPMPVRVRGVGVVQVADLPHITVHVPRTLHLEASGAVYSTVSPSAGGEAEFTGCGDATLGATSGGLHLTLNGSGDVRAENVVGDLAATLNGSGDLRVAGAHGSAAMRLNGSGDLGIGNVGGALDAALHGSGDLRAGDVAGPTKLELTGSGDVNVGNVHGGLSTEVVGSGDVDVASAEGANVELQLSASGDVTVHHGRADRLAISNNGSGDVRFGGAAATANLELHGSGGISVASATHVTQHDSGSGDINVGQ
ncbi:MAG: DUF2807 domain-containing protein [Terricaulis sp.]